jgi:hypothetical protein
LISSRASRVARLRLLLPGIAVAAALLVPCTSADAAGPALEWVQQAPTTAPVARNSAVSIYDPAQRQVVLFGGTATAPLADTWTWDGTDWSAATPAESPAARFSAGFAYDSAAGRAILFGGSNTTPYLTETWAWSGGEWTQLTPTTTPIGRTSPSLAYDQATREVVMFGGYNATPRAETWTWDGQNWTELTPPQSPPARNGAVLAYDPQLGELVLFGGSGTSGRFNDTWTWNGETWTQLSPPQSPPVRSGAGLVWDPALGELVLFGGRKALGTAGLLNDTWTFDGLTWTELSPSGSPAAREPASFAYDEPRADAVLFGGTGPSGARFEDTWVLRSELEPPAVLLTGAIDHGTYGFGEAVPTSFVCEAGPVGATTESCADSNGAIGGVGALETSSLGPHLYRVATVSSTGLKGEATIEYEVIKGPQSIDFVQPADHAVGDPDFDLAVSASSGLPVSLASSTPSVCTLAGAAVHLVAVGDCTIEAGQAGDANYEPASGVSRTFAVKAAGPPAAGSPTPGSGAAGGKGAPTLDLRYTPNSPHQSVRDGDPRWTFRFSSAPAADFYCSLDGAAFKRCTSPTVYRHLRKGSHRFRVYAVDAAGVRSTTRQVRFRARAAS